MTNLSDKDKKAIEAIGLGPDNAGADIPVRKDDGEPASDKSLPGDRRKTGPFGQRLVNYKYSRLVQLATFMSYAVHNGNLADAQTIAKAYDEQLDAVLGRKQEIWRG